MADDSLPVFILACVSCGKTVSGKEEKCPRCGASFEDLDFECPFCGEAVKLSQNKCGSCGTEFEVFAGEVAESSSVELDGEESAAPSGKSGESPVEYECPACGKPVGEEDTKCPHCGAVFSG